MTPKGKDQKALEAFLRELGPSPAIERFLREYGNPRTKCSYSGHLVLYRRWMKKEKGIEMTPDAMIQDNLRAVFESAPSDVVAKRKWTNLLSEYVNTYLIAKGMGDSTRKVAVASVRGF